MITIQKGDPVAVSLLGKPRRRAEQGYRMTHYLLRRETEDGVLLFNTLTCELLFLTREEEAEALRSDELLSRGFVVPCGCDEHSRAAAIRRLMRQTLRSGERMYDYCVFMTMSCNARCPYCFEKGQKGGTMTAETARRTARYMAEHCGGKKITVRWFGGEPLCNRQMIDVICGELTALGVEFDSAITSNSYLFDREIAETAKELWHLKSIQVTLDGTEEIYNRTKAYVNTSRGNPFRVVLDNTEMLLDMGFAVDIRLNVGPENADDLMELIDVLDRRFHGREKLTVYPHLLFQLTEADRELRDCVAEKNLALIAKLRRCGLAKRGSTLTLPRRLLFTLCMADGGAGCAILPDGRISVCDNAGERAAVGSIDRDAPWDQDTLALWSETAEERPACETCALYPQCRILRHCAEYRCFESTVQQRRDEYAEAMLEAYRSFRPSEPAEKTAALQKSAEKHAERPVVRLSREYVSERIGESFAVVTLDDEGELSDRIIRVDEIGLTILEHLRQDISREDLIRCLAEEYGAAEDEVAETVDIYLAELDRHGLTV